ncbi:MAG: SEL1-like repeat protein [Campylobacterales bacterium]|nr:SEL1-like repeat protein [Campylobacterales bacterium]
MDENRALKKHLHIQNYYILSTKIVTDNIIVYQAENMKQNREVALYEYFPKEIAKRHYKTESDSLVYVHPSNSQFFSSQKSILKEIYDKLKLISHPSIPVIYETIETNGTLYIATQIKDKALSLDEQLHNDKNLFSEQFLGRLALKITRIFAILQRHDLQASNLTLQNILLNSVNEEPLFLYTDYKAFNQNTIQESIKELGKMLESILNVNSVIQTYSASLQGLIKRMTSDEASKQFKTFEELQTLLQSYESIPSQQECTLDEKKSAPLSPLTSFITILLSLGFLYYIFTQSNITPQNLNWFDSLRYHILGYVGNAKAQSTLGLMYEKGYYVDANIHEAIQWYTKVADEDEDVQITLANIYKNVDSVKDSKKSLEIMMQLAHKNNLYAQKLVGYSYLKGEGVAKDYKEARHWFERADAQGDAYACGIIGWMYETGNGANKNFSKALEYFKKGATRNDDYSKKSIARVEEKINEETKTNLYNQSRKNYEIGIAYEYGKGKAKNHKLAVEYYMKAAQIKHPYAAFRIGQIYERSNEIQRDYNAAFYWYKKAAEENADSLAYYRVSKLYRAGHGVMKNDALAFQWCKEAAERGLGVARGIMGASYEYGWGTQKNYDQARYWYQLAIESGYNNARDSLEKLNEKISAQAKIQATPQVRNIQRTTTKVSTPKTVTYTSRANELEVVNIRSCLACHGQYFEKRAFGKSAIVSRMSKSQIITALKGYKRGTYGGAMKGVMRGQVIRYSDRALEKVAKTIAGN